VGKKKFCRKSIAKVAFIYDIHKIVYICTNNLRTEMEQDKEIRTKEKATQYAFLGGFAGLHNFYLGETSRGVWKVIVALIIGSMTIGTGGMAGGIFIPLLFWGNFVRGFRLSGMSQNKFDLRYNTQLFVKRGEEEPPAPVEVADEIFKLGELFEKGVINFEEFERRKQRLLD
jgi:TM2 domain-containing membrane protein YozV